MIYHDEILDSKKSKINEKKIFVSKDKKKLNKSDLTKLEKHKEKYSNSHIALMKKLMKEGNTFAVAHKMSIKKIEK